MALFNPTNDIMEEICPLDFHFIARKAEVDELNNLSKANS